MEMSLDALIREVLDAAADPLGQLDLASHRAVDLTELGDALLTHFVDRCRRSGHTWAEIGEHLGVTRQAVQKRFVGYAGEQVTFERFTPRAKAAFERAEQVAVELRHNYVGTEHQLLALFDVEGNLALDVLTSLGVTRDSIDTALAAAVPNGVDDVTPPLFRTPRLRQALEEAVNVALDLRHNYIGCEHLLLGLYRGQDGLARRFLEAQGATDDKVTAAVMERLAKYTKG
ncbi:MAG TPA: Clp protease N-terminal domain-containing protein [Acidimicrobiales bacterium]|nr:Clp protease N-terminal domain-containing protein [Acidimicrobiales bacterium]